MGTQQLFVTIQTVTHTRRNPNCAIRNYGGLRPIAQESGENNKDQNSQSETPARDFGRGGSGSNRQGWIMLHSGEAQSSFTEKFQCGARQVTIDFGGAGTSCNANIIVARQVGKSTLQQMTSRGLMETSSIQIGTVSCAIRGGNVFGK
jgi:hypothetical protein